MTTSSVHTAHDAKSHHGHASARVHSEHQRLLGTLPFDERRDVEDAQRGLVDAGPSVIRDADGQVVWDIESFGFLSAVGPDTVHPSLWRQGQLNIVHGLFLVTPGLYQVRGFDISNISFVEGDRGVVVVDPLSSREVARAALDLYRKHRGDRPVTGVIYTHSHADHFGGVRGVVDDRSVSSGAVPIIAPEGFTSAAVEENVYAGNAMARRASYMFGTELAPGPLGHVGVGLGQAVSHGSLSLIPPTVEITHTGQELVVDGVRFVFQLTPDTEAPAEFHFFLPELHALCIPENAAHTLHNVLTPRGALVRDAHAWAHYLGEAIELFGNETELVFASHNWPTWGHERAVQFIGEQRDLYGYLHDQTLRLINQGFTGPEIAEDLVLPPALEKAWHARGLYGSVSFNVKSIYQRYMGWYDGNPANLWKHPPVEAGRRYLEFMGGADAVVAKAQVSFDEGDYRWVAEVLSHVVFAQPDHAEAKQLLADTYEQLGFAAESGPWRCIYLSASQELLQDRRLPLKGVPLSPELLDQLSLEQVFDALATRVNGPRAWEVDLSLDIVDADAGQTHRVSLSNGVLWHSTSTRSGTAELTVTGPRSALTALLTGRAGTSGAKDPGLAFAGDVSVLARLRAVLDRPDPNFALVTP